MTTKFSQEAIREAVTRCKMPGRSIAYVTGDLTDGVHVVRDAIAEAGLKIASQRVARAFFTYRFDNGSRFDIVHVHTSPDWVVTEVREVLFDHHLHEETPRPPHTQSWFDAIAARGKSRVA